MFNAKTPGNVNSFLTFFEEVTSCEVYDVAQKISEYYYIPEQDPISLNFMNAGYDTILFLMNGSSFIFNYIIHICLIVSLPLALLLE